MSSSAAVKSNSAATKASRKSAALPPETVEYLKAWMMSPEHIAHPYPTEQEKAQIMAETGIELKQLTNWFVNNRKRYWKPRVEAKLQKYGSPARSPAAPAASQQQQPRASAAGGLSISILHMGPCKPPQQQASASFPALPNPPSPGFGPAAGGALDLVPPYDDPHTISEGSSASSSDDDSVGGSSASGAGRPRAAPSAALGPSSAASQFLLTRLAQGAVAAAQTCSSSTSSSFPSLMAAAPAAGGFRRHEEVDVHVLRPEGSDGSALPTIRDLTIKSSVPKERVLATFKCPISYTIPYDIEHDKRKVQSRRDGEVLRVKKHYLKLYLATRGIHSVSSPVGRDDAGSAAGSDDDDEPFLPPSVAPAPFSSTAPVHAVSPAKGEEKKRARSLTCSDACSGKDDSRLPLRKRARTSSGSLATGGDGDAEWRELCQNAKSLFCDTLPGLEEAARMFGYVSS